jgi:hypothetical protein
VEVGGDGVEGVGREKRVGRGVERVWRWEWRRGCGVVVAGSGSNPNFPGQRRVAQLVVL